MRVGRHRASAARAALGVCLGLIAALAGFAGSATASPPRPSGLEVVGGEAWHPDNRFSLTWTSPAPASPALTATRYRVRDPLGTTIGESRLGWVGDGIGPLIVPTTPGAYSAEVWFEDSTGQQGPAATVPLRFDDVSPAPVQPQAVSGWIGRTAFPLRVHLGHPSGPAPLSGIRGYAVAIDTTPAGSPCTAADRCDDAETTLRGGVTDDELAIGHLPEGMSYLHAVAVSGAGMKSATSGSTVLHTDTTDPVTQLAGLPTGWTNRAVQLTANATDTGAGMEPSGQGPLPFTAIQVDGGAPSIGPGGSVLAGVVDEGVHRIDYYARDAAGNVDDGAWTNGIADHAPRTAVVRIDRTPPRLAFANAEDPRDPELLRVRIADQLSGPDSSHGRIGVRRAGSGDRFAALPAVPGDAGELRARWDSDTFPAGDYEFQATGYDAAGNTATTSRRQNGGAMVLSNPLKATTSLRAGFRGHGLRSDRPLRSPRPPQRTAHQRQELAPRRRAGPSRRALRRRGTSGRPHIDGDDSPRRDLLDPHRSRPEPDDRGQLRGQPDAGAIGGTHTPARGAKQGAPASLSGRRQGRRGAADLPWTAGRRAGRDPGQE